MTTNTDPDNARDLLARVILLRARHEALGMQHELVDDLLALLGGAARALLLYRRSRGVHPDLSAARAAQMLADSVLERLGVIGEDQTDDEIRRGSAGLLLDECSVAAARVERRRQ